MIKIVIYIPSLSGGGAERVAVLIARQCVLRGHRVAIVVDSFDGPNRELVPQNVVVRELGPGSHFATLPRLRSFIRDFAPDIVYAQLGLQPLKILFATIGILSWQKVVISYHSSYDPKARLGGRLTYRMAALLTRSTGATIAVSNDIRDELVSRFKASKKRIQVVHNPVDLEWIRKQSTESLPLWLEGRRYILSVGRMVHQKDYPSLLRAFARIQGDIPHDLIILGEGPLRKNLEILIDECGLKERVHMPGYLPNPFPVYREADLFVLASSFEGFGNVLVEAMALGVPVVATSCPGGPKEILAEGRYGKLVPVGDPEALARAMLSTLSAPPNPELLKTRALNFSLEKVADAYLEFFSGNHMCINFFERIKSILK